MKAQILDADYKMVNNKPVVRLFCKDEDGGEACVFQEDFFPYFYCRPEDDEAKEKIASLLEENFSGDLKKIEEVEKYLPMGYDPEKREVLKITLTTPSNVPKVKEFLGKNARVKRFYETDVLFKYRYLADMGLGGMHWIDVDGKTVNTDTVGPRAVKAEQVKKLDRRDRADLNYLSFDIECIPQQDDRMVDAEKDPIVLISCAFEPEFQGKEDMVLVAKPGKTDGKHFADEEEMLEGFLDVLDRYDPDIITGYNVEDFDLPYVLQRLEKHGLPKDLGRCEKHSYFRKFGNTSDVTIVGRAVVDPYQILKRDPYTRPMRYNLDTVSQKLLGEGKEDVEYDEMKELWGSQGEKLQRFVDYSRQDARLPLRLLMERGLLEKFFELSRISGLVLDDSMGGQTQRISNYLLREFNDRGFILPAKPSDEELRKRKRNREKEALKGGLVLEPDKGLHTDSCISVLDFKSLYPSIMSTYNICPTTLVEGEVDVEVSESPDATHFVKKDTRKGILPKIVEYLIDTRSEVKRRMKETDDENEKTRYNARQLALKDMTNSFYGYSGYPRTRVYRLSVANAITAYGRATIEKTRDMIEKEFDREVVYGDTDSVMVKPDTKDLDEAHRVSKDMSQHITDTLPGRLILEPEKVYRSLLILTKKRYAGWAFEKAGDGWEEDIDMKGIETVRRDWPPIVSDTMEEVIEIILEEGHINEAVEHVQEIITKLYNDEVPLERLQVVKSLSKKPENYDGVLPHIELAKKIKDRDPSNAPMPGDRIPFIIIKGNQMLSERSEHPDYIRENGLEVDSDYYIHSQLLPPLERIFEGIGVDKQELLGNGRQTDLDELLNGSSVERDRDVSVDRSPRETVIEDLLGFTCKDCKRDFRRVPLKGRCDCGGDIYGKGHGSIGKKVEFHAA